MIPNRKIFPRDDVIDITPCPRGIDFLMKNTDTNLFVLIMLDNWSKVAHLKENKSGQKVYEVYDYNVFWDKKTGQFMRELIKFRESLTLPLQKDRLWCSI